MIIFIFCPELSKEKKIDWIFSCLFVSVVLLLSLSAPERISLFVHSLTCAMYDAKT